MIFLPEPAASGPVCSYRLPIRAAHLPPARAGGKIAAAVAPAGPFDATHAKDFLVPPCRKQQSHHSGHTPILTHATPLLGLAQKLSGNFRLSKDSRNPSHSANPMGWTETIRMALQLKAEKTSLWKASAGEQRFPGSDRVRLVERRRSRHLAEGGIGPLPFQRRACRERYPQPGALPWSLFQSLLNCLEFILAGAF